MRPAESDDPVENPDLLAAIADFAREPSQAHRERLFAALPRATYLVPILEDALSLRPGGAGREHVIEPGSRFRLLVCADPETREELLPIFSDASEVAAFTDEKVSVLLLALPEVHGLLASEPAYAGAVVNPAGTAIPMSRKLLATLGAPARP